MSAKKPPITLYPLFLLLFILALNALTAGAMLMLKPDGSLIQLNPEWLGKTPFPN
jgi:hypothetical protein